MKIIEELRRKIHRIWYNKIWGFNKHKLRILNIEKYDWCDADERMFHACFTILGDFVEKELGRETNSKYPDCEYRGYRLHAVQGGNEEAIDSWLWYKNELPKEIKDYNDYWERKYGGHAKIEGGRIILPDIRLQSPEEEEKYKGWNYINRLQNQKLQELMAIRKSLWT